MDRTFLGTWSARSFDQLDKKIRGAYLSADGPGALPTHRRSKPLRPIVVPAGSYDHVGSSLAWAYKEIGESILPPAFVVVGSYPGDDVAINLFVNWRTPFGVVKVQKEIGKEIARKARLSNCLEPFITDIHIETQLPFLQHACRDQLDNIHVIPILVGNTSKARWAAVGEALAEVIEHHKLGFIGCVPIDAGVASYLSALNGAEAVNSAKRRNLSHPDVLGVVAETMIHLYSRGGVTISRLREQYTMMF